MKKIPREFWLLKDFVKNRPGEYAVCIDHKPEAPIFFDSLHVIEYSAYEKAIDKPPALTLEEHVNKYHSPTRGYDTIIYTGSGLMGREIENIRSCDVVIFAGGRSGSLGEFAIAYDEGKVIGALQGTEGIADRLDEIIDIIRKKTEAYICHHSDPESLLDDLEAVYRDRILPGYLKTIDGHNPDGVLDV